MIKVREDLTGQWFERLLVIEQTEDYVSPSGIRKTQWLCECSCSEHKRVVVQGMALKRGLTKSCGCLRKELTRDRGKNNRKINTYDLNGEYGIGWTINTNREFYFDLNNYERIKDYCWYERVQEDGYCSLCATIENRSIKMTKFLGYKNHDHINRNPFDNRDENLRPATPTENARNHSLSKRNKSGVSGVCWDKSCSKWTAYIKDNGKDKHLGVFSDKHEAIKVRLQAELKYYGKDFAPQRHLFEEYGINQTQENL